MVRFMLTAFCPVLLTVVCAVSSADDAAAKYRLTDPDLKVVQIDSSPTESFLSIRADSTGRLFVGGREAVFVYEPNDKGGYAPRHELYRFPKDSWVYDIEIRGNDLYVLTLSALYLFENGVTERENIKPKRLIWGLPDWHVHQAFHGLAWGPEGDLYISMGDLMVWYGDYSRADHWGHWTMFSQPAGTRTPYTGVGGVFRCRPDGTNLQVVAGGTRNSCGLVFDSAWNLFCNDNDHEGLPTEYAPGKLLHVTPHADFGWPRGWMARKTPDRADLLETIIPDMGRAVPVGQTFYDEEYLPKRYRNNLLLARWGRRSITRYPLRQRGASFAAEEITLLEGFDKTRPVGVAVGRGGRIFATLAYMAHNEGSPTYPSDLIMITRADDTDSHPFKAVDLTTADQTKLYEELASSSSWRARRAHLEILRRRGETASNAVLGLIFGSNTNKPLSGRYLWLTAASAADANPDDQSTVVEMLENLLKADDTDLGVQAVRATAEFFANHDRAEAIFEQALAQPDPRIRQAAITGLFNSNRPIPDSLINGPARSVDTYLRQAATILLARKASQDKLRSLCESKDSRTRLAGVLAIGFRLTLPAATKPLDERLPLQPWPNEEPYTIHYAKETVDLRKLGRLGAFTTAEHWNAGERSSQQEALFAMLLARLDDPSEQVRLQSAHFLSLLNDKRSEKRLNSVRQQSQRERLVRSPLAGIGQLWVTGPFDDQNKGFSQSHAPQEGPINLSEKYRSSGKPIRWEKLLKKQMFDFTKSHGDTAGKSVYVYFRLESPRPQQAMLLPGSDDGLQIFHNGKEVFTIDIDRGGLPLQDVVFLDLQAGSNEILIRIRNIADEHNLYLHYRSLEGSVKWTLPERFDEAGLSDRLKSAATTSEAKIPAELLGVDWAQAVGEGDAERGRKLFSADGIGCAKCHSISNDVAVQGGPSLADAGARFTVPYLVESVLLPSHKVSPLFKASSLVTDDGKVHSGLIISETAEKLILLTREAKKIELAKSSIEERKLQTLSPMPAGLVQKQGELRDLLAYLVAQRPVSSSSQAKSNKLDISGPLEYGKTAQGERVDQFKLTNANGIEASIINYGAALISLKVPDRNGKIDDIVLGYDNMQGYLEDPIFAGCVVGRFANRISKGKFTLDGKEYPLAINFGKHHLHGGRVGFNRKVWQAKAYRKPDEVGVEFRLTSPDGEEGYPGKLDVVMTYSLNNKNELTIDYQAETDKPTHVNLTQHSYFNLAGHDSGDVLGHRLRLNCARYLPVDADGVPTGEIASVTGTVFDYRKQQTIGSRIRQQPDIYDHCMVIQRKEKGVALLAYVSEPKSGRVMEVLTDQPGAQLYTSIHMSRVAGRGGTIYRKYAGLCLETQHFPDTPNKPNFPSTVLRPGEVFKSKTIHRFSTE